MCLGVGIMDGLVSERASQREREKEWRKSKAGCLLGVGKKIYPDIFPHIYIWHFSASINNFFWHSKSLRSANLQKIYKYFVNESSHKASYTQTLTKCGTWKRENFWEKSLTTMKKNKNYSNRKSSTSTVLDEQEPISSFWLARADNRGRQCEQHSWATYGNLIFRSGCRGSLLHSWGDLYVTPVISWRSWPIIHPVRTRYVRTNVFKDVGKILG